MPHSRWVHLTRVAAAAGLAAFAAVTLFAPQDGDLSAFFNTWVYDGLMVLACVITGSHAYLVARERAAWTVITLALALLDVRRVLVRDLQASDVPVDGGSRVHRLLPPALRRHRPAAALAGPFDRRHALARRRDRRARRGSARRGRDRRGGARKHLGLDDRRSSRTSRIRSATSSCSRPSSASSP